MRRMQILGNYADPHRCILSVAMKIGTVTINIFEINGFFNNNFSIMNAPFSIQSHVFYHYNFIYLGFSSWLNYWMAFFLLSKLKNLKVKISDSKIHLQTLFWKKFFFLYLILNIIILYSHIHCIYIYNYVFYNK